MSTSKTSQATVGAATQASLNDKAVRNLADAIFKHLQDEGCQAKDIISVSSQLLGLVTDQIRDGAHRS
jgi:N-acetylglucosamine kinase-like BadF-type ATPase